MKHTLLIAAAATALMAVPTFASAQDTYNSDQEGWYLKGAAGYGIGTDIDVTGTLEGDIEAEGNVAGNLGVGYDFGENWRIEVDGTTNWNDFGAISQAPASFGKLRTDALMLNAIYDFSDFNRWEPYIGAGIGIVRGDASLAAHDFVAVDGASQVVNPTCIGERGSRAQIDGFSCNADGNDTSLGWQLLAGLGYAITDNLSWDTNYRYMQAGDQRYDASFTNVATGASRDGQIELDGIGAHQLLTGFRYRFGGEKYVAPPPPPPPPPPPELVTCYDGSQARFASECPTPPPPPPTTFACEDGINFVTDLSQCPVRETLILCPDNVTTVSDASACPPITRSGETLANLCGEQYRQEIIYYEFNKGQSAETRNTINRILDIGQFCSVDNIRVVGHTDTSGAASYNLALSKRRAADALNELVREGVNRNLITSEGKGETEPFVQTGDGVKERLNRRTEVLLTLSETGALSFN